jgi:phosphatidylinositol alpha-1,6-mannosyltransferase
MQKQIAKGLFSLFSPEGRRGRLSILLFHKVPRFADPLVPDELCLRQFEQVLDWLETYANVIPLSEALKAIRLGRLPSRSVVLTFDDGYSDWLDTVAPTLMRRNMPATFFLSTQQFEGPALWHERILEAVRALPERGAILPYGFGAFRNLESTACRARLINGLQERLKYSSLSERTREIESLEAQSSGLLLRAKRFSADSARSLHSSGFEIGAHTSQHPILSECNEYEARSEIAGCREELQNIVRGKITSFAYPNGRAKRDFDASHVRMVQEAGYDCAVATGGGAVTVNANIFQLPRFSPWGGGHLKTAYQMIRNMLSPDSKIQVAMTTPANPPVRALLVASTFPPIHGGSAVVYESLCKHMPRGTIRVLTARENYLTKKEIPGWLDYDKKATFPIDRINYLRPLMLPPPLNIAVSIYRLLFQDLPLYANVLWSAVRLVKRHHINLICVGELVTTSWLGLALRKLFGCRLLIYVHGEEITTTTGGRLHGARRQAYLEASDKVVAVSSFTCDALTNIMNISPNSVTLLENGVDTEIFTPGEKNIELLTKYSLTSKKIVLTVGRLVPRKGMDMGIRAMAKVVRQFPETHYVIVGDGEYRHALMELIADLNLEKSVTLIGKVSEQDLISWFRTCEFFLMPNRTMPDGDTEGFGLVFREANACGKPVIGGRAGGAVEAVIHNETGFLVDGNDVDEISLSILRLLSDPDLTKSLGQRGLIVARENTTKIMADRFHSVCIRVLRD